MNKANIVKAVKNAVSLLIQDKIEELCLLLPDSMANIEGVRERLSDYGGELTQPPDSAFEDLDIYLIEYPDSGYYCALDFDLWIDGEQSDLTLKGYILNNGDFELSSIRIL
jgi:hypothetical protein